MSHDELLAWAAQHGVVATGPVEVRVRPWATVLRIPSASGDVWLKAGAPQTAYEAALYELLSGIAPAWVLAPLAIDAERGRLLLPDGGPALSDAGPAFAAALGAYGALQRTVAPHADALVALGVPDMRPTVMPERLEEALEVVDGETRRRVAPLREEYAEWCSQLAASPLPASLDHNDLHPANVLAGEPVRFYDWGDAVVAHPFAAMLVPLGMADDREAARDAYLAGFEGEGLGATLDLACRVARVARALTWERAVRAARDAGDAIDPAWASAAADWLATLLGPTSLPGAE